MKPVNFVNSCAQGDLFIRRIDTLPKNIKPLKPVNGQFIVAHSETGHHHVIEADLGCKVYEDEKDPMTLYLEIIDATEVTLRHLRSFDTHKPIAFLKGIFRFRRARERTPEGWRKVQD